MANDLKSLIEKLAQEESKEKKEREQIFSKYKHIFSKIDTRLDADEFSKFFSHPMYRKKYFPTRSSNLEQQYAGHLSKKPENFNILKKALTVLVDSESKGKPLQEIIDDVWAEIADWNKKNYFKPDIFSTILHLLNPNKYAIVNKKVEEFLEQEHGIGFSGEKKNEWRVYPQANEKLIELAGQHGCDLYTLDRVIALKKPTDEEEFEFVKKDFESTKKEQTDDAGTTNSKGEKENWAQYRKRRFKQLEKVLTSSLSSYFEDAKMHKGSEWQRNGYTQYSWLGYHFSKVAWKEVDETQFQVALGPDDPITAGLWIDANNKKEKAHACKQIAENTEKFVQLLKQLDPEYYVGLHKGKDWQEWKISELKDKEAPIIVNEIVIALSRADTEFYVTRYFDQNEAVDLKNAVAAEFVKTFEEMVPIRDFLSLTQILTPTMNDPDPMSSTSNPNCDDYKEKGYFEILKKKKQMIFYGPPGTGKTWTANKLAECWCREKQSQPIQRSTWLNIAAKVLLENNGEMMHYTEIGEKAEAIRQSGTVTPEETIGRDIRDDITNAENSIFRHEDGDTGKYGLDVPTTFLRAAEIVLFAENKAMHLTDITNKIMEKKLVETEGYSPERTLSTDIRRYIANPEKTPKFIQTGAATFGLATEIPQCRIIPVTFHPSYSYEDFLEGYRPKTEEEWKKSQSSPYTLDKGIFKRIKESAEENEQIDYFLIIDEINRGNISKILGELISLLEVDYRGPEHQRILAYSKESFFVPENIYIIGTMNTADKSLVQIDAALRRRFAFEELLPNPAILDKFANAKKYKRILEKLNAKILIGRKEFRDKQVGHSYFLKLETDEDVQFMFKHEIIPLLQDYFYYDYQIIREILGKEIIMEKEDRVVDEIFKTENASRFVEKLKTALGCDDNGNGGGKYQPLADFLKNSGKQEVTLTFTQIEEIIDAKLPPSAREHRAWWGNAPPADGGQTQRAYWITAGYQVKSGSLMITEDEEKVTFEKINEETNQE